jgi:hypothetical protein
MEVVVVPNCLHHFHEDVPRGHLLDGILCVLQRQPEDGIADLLQPLWQHDGVSSQNGG